MKSIVKLDTPLVSPPSDFKGDFFKGMTHTLLTTDRSYFLHFCRLVVFAAHVVHTVDVAMSVVYLCFFFFFLINYLHIWLLSFFFFFFLLFSTEIQIGLVGVGLINVEDRSGTLSLDKGD